MTLLTDDFNRADSAVSLGTPSDGGVPWEILGGTHGISSDRAYLVDTAGGIVVGDDVTGEHLLCPAVRDTHLFDAADVSIDLIVPGAADSTHNGFVLFNWNPLTNHGYAVRHENWPFNAWVYRFDAAGNHLVQATNVNFPTAPWPVPSTLRVLYDLADTEHIQVWFNSVLVYDQHDNVLTGSPGWDPGSHAGYAGGAASSVSGFYWDNFSAVGAIPPGAPNGDPKIELPVVATARAAAAISPAVSGDAVGP